MSPRNHLLVEPPGAFEPAATWRAHILKLERLLPQHPELRYSLDLARDHLRWIVANPPPASR
jgi:hypothetical protein